MKHSPKTISSIYVFITVCLLSLHLSGCAQTPNSNDSNESTQSLKTSSISTSQSARLPESYTEKRSRVSSIARRDMQAFLERIPLGREQLYGFSSRHDFSIASLGQPYQMHTIDPNVLASHMDSIHLAFDPLDVWRVPIMVHGSYRALLTVALQAGNYEVVEVGARVLAAELFEFERQNTRPQDGYERHLLRVFQLRSDFIFVTHPLQLPAVSEIFPIGSARKHLGLAGSNTDARALSPETLARVLATALESRQQVAQ